jgi:hypothetical protein
MLVLGWLHQRHVSHGCQGAPAGAPAAALYAGAGAAGGGTVAGPAPVGRLVPDPPPPNDFAPAIPPPEPRDCSSLEKMIRVSGGPRVPRAPPRPLLRDPRPDFPIILQRLRCPLHTIPSERGKKYRKTKPASAAKVGSSWRPRRAMKLALLLCPIRIRAAYSRMPAILSAIRCLLARSRRSLAGRSCTRPGDACAAPVPLPLQYADGFTVKHREGVHSP